MPVQFKTVARPNPQKPKDPKKYYALAVSSGEITVRELSTQISKRSTVSTADVIAVLESLLEVLPERIAEGDIVRLGDFGSFNLTIRGKGSTKEEEVTTNNIIGNSLNFRPGKELQKALDTISYKKAQ